jgi:hypothetical protein
MAKNRHINSCSGLWIPVLLLAWLCTSAEILAEERATTYEGTMQGLNCMYFNMECPKEDLDIYAALENDFVLVIESKSVSQSGSMLIP